VRLVTRTINDHYFVLTVTSFLVTAAPLLKGGLLGLGATLAATLVPAFEAAHIPPLAALQRSQLEQKAHRLAPRLAVAGLGMVIVALLVLAFPVRSLGPGFVALFLLIIGLALVSPWLVFRLSRLVAAPLGRCFGLQLRLAIGGVADSLSRTGIAIAALMLAVATLVGVGVMIASFRASVDVWLQSTLRADIYVGLPGVRSSTTRGSLDPALIGRLRNLPGIAGLSTGRGTRVAGEQGHTEVLALGLSPGLKPNYPLEAGDPEEVWKRFAAGEAVLVSEPLAWHRGLAVGDQVRLRTDYGPQRFAVAGIYHDYGTGEGEVLMPRTLYERHFEDRGVSAVGIYLQPAADPDTVLVAAREQVAAAAAGQQVLVRPGAEIRAQSLEIFDRTFTITRVLRLLAVLVAFIGILSAFLALQLERARELAILRATGMTPGQVGGQVALQTLFMGLVAGLLALPTGLVLAEVLIHVINRRSFGWSMQTLVEPGILFQAVLLAVAAALLAAVYPGWRMARTSPAAALREE
jgi:putative ABC transport system permease protein